MNEKLKIIVSEIFDLAPEDVTPKLTPETVDLWDSLNHLKLVTAVEQEFGLKLSMVEIEGITSLGVLASLVGAREPTS